MRVLVLRPEGEGAAMAEALGALGHQAVLAPMLTIVPDAGAAAGIRDIRVAGAIRAVLLTSGNALAGLDVGSLGLAGVPVIAVGAATARRARAAGFVEVASVDGDADDVLAHVLALPASEGTCLHLCGADLRLDLAGALAAGGLSARRVVTYRAVPAEKLASDVVAALRQGAIEGVMVTSERMAGAFARALARGLGEGEGGDPGDLKRVLDRLWFFCLSPRVAKGLAALHSDKVLIAGTPDLPALLALLANVTC